MCFIQGRVTACYIKSPGKKYFPLPAQRLTTLDICRCDFTAQRLLLDPVDAQHLHLRICLSQAVSAYLETYSHRKSQIAGTAFHRLKRLPLCLSTQRSQKVTFPGLATGFARVVFSHFTSPPTPSIQTLASRTGMRLPFCI